MLASLKAYDLIQSENMKQCNFKSLSVNQFIGYLYFNISNQVLLF